MPPRTVSIVGTGSFCTGESESFADTWTIYRAQDSAALCESLCLQNPSCHGFTTYVASGCDACLHYSTCEFTTSTTCSGTVTAYAVTTPSSMPPRSTFFQSTDSLSLASDQTRWQVVQGAAECHLYAICPIGDTLYGQGMEVPFLGVCMSGSSYPSRDCAQSQAVVIESPRFSGFRNITFELGGGHSMSANPGTFDSISTGFLGVALREASSNSFIDYAARTTSCCTSGGSAVNAYSMHSFHILNFDMEYVLDFIDFKSGGWAHAGLANVHMS